MFERNAAAFLFVAGCVRFAASISCYDCSSVNNSMCLDPTIYDQETLDKFLPSKPCGSGIYPSSQHDFLCRKIVQTILNKGYEPEVRVTRGCGWVRYRKDCYKMNNEDHLETVCQCFSDGCNGAASLSGAGLAVAVTAATVAFGKGWSGA